MFRWVTQVYPDAPWVYHLSRRRFMRLSRYSVRRILHGRQLLGDGSLPTGHARRKPRTGILHHPRLPGRGRTRPDGHGWIARAGWRRFLRHRRLRPDARQTEQLVAGQAASRRFPLPHQTQRRHHRHRQRKYRAGGELGEDLIGDADARSSRYSPERHRRDRNDLVRAGPGGFRAADRGSPDADRGTTRMEHLPQRGPRRRTSGRNTRRHACRDRGLH